MTAIPSELDPATAQYLKWLDDAGCLTKRDGAILRLLDRVRVASLDQIRRIWWPAAPDNARQRLYHLIQHRVIQYVQFDGTQFRLKKRDMIRYGLTFSKSLYTITPLGQAWLAQHHPQDLSGRSLRQDQLHHDLLLAEVNTRLAEAVIRRGQGWQYDWYGESQAGLEQAGKPICLPPGLAVISRISDGRPHRFPIFIQLDLDPTEPHVRNDSPFAYQIATYEEMLQWPWTAHPLLRILPYFPAVVWIVDADEERLQNLAHSLQKHSHSWIGYALACRADLFAGQDILTTPAWILLPAVKPGSLIGLEPDQRQPLFNKAWLKTLQERARPSEKSTDTPVPVGRIIPVSLQPTLSTVPPPAAAPPTQPSALLPDQPAIPAAGLTRSPAMSEPKIVPPISPPSPAMRSRQAEQPPVQPAAPSPPPSPPAAPTSSPSKPAQPEPTVIRPPHRPPASRSDRAATPSSRNMSTKELLNGVRSKFIDSIPATYGFPIWVDYPLGVPGSGEPPWSRPGSLFIIEAETTGIKNVSFFVDVIDTPPPWSDWLAAYEKLYRSQVTARYPASQGVVVLLPNLEAGMQLETDFYAKPPRHFMLWMITQADFLAAPDILFEPIYFTAQWHQGGVKSERGPLLVR